MVHVSRSPADRLRLLNVKEASRETSLCLAAAHALVLLDDGTVVGDPMEKTTLEALEWTLSKGRPIKDFHYSYPLIISLQVMSFHHLLAPPIVFNSIFVVDFNFPLRSKGCPLSQLYLGEPSSQPSKVHLRPSKLCWLKFRRVMMRPISGIPKEVAASWRWESRIWNLWGPIK